MNTVVNGDEQGTQEGRIRKIVSCLQMVGVSPRQPFFGNGGHHPAVEGDGEFHTKYAAVDVEGAVSAVHRQAVAEKGEVFPDGGDQSPAAVQIVPGHHVKEFLLDVQ